MDCMCESCDGGDCSRCGFSLQDDYEDDDDMEKRVYVCDECGQQASGDCPYKMMTTRCPAVIDEVAERSE